MPVVDIKEHIDAPPEKVWDLMCDIRRGPEWITVMLETLYVSEDWIQQGSMYRELSKVGPSKSVTEWTVTAFDAGHSQVHEAHENPLEVTLTIAVEPDGRGTMLKHHTEYRMMPVFRPLGWLLEQIFAKRLMDKQLRQSIQNAKQILESESMTTVNLNITPIQVGLRTFTPKAHESEECGYWAEIVELPGCVSQGGTLQELRDNLRKAIESVLAVEEEDRSPK